MRFKKRNLLEVVLLTFAITLLSGKKVEVGPVSKLENNLKNESLNLTSSVYNKIALSGFVSFKAFEQAFYGFQNLQNHDRKTLTIIDFSLPSTEKRMVVIDMINHTVLYHTIVSHGQNSGEKLATHFSNKHESFQSSLGFFTTGKTYQGSNGYSLNLEGLEKGINDEAFARRIVIHGADYCSEEFIQNNGFLGRSQGCPAVPRELTIPIINTIKDGGLLYIFADQTSYLSSTKILNGFQ